MKTLIIILLSICFLFAQRPNSIKNYHIVNGQIDSSKVNTGFKSYIQYQGNFGSKIQNTLTKLRTGDVRFGSSDTVRFVILTDSRNGWIDPFFTALKAAYPNVPITYDNLANGGYNIASNFALMFEDAVIHQNPDCFIWGEHEGDTHLYEALNYHLLRKIRRTTTSDIVFINSNPKKPYSGNWRNHEYDPERDVARKLNAEFVDVYARWKRMYDAGIDMTQYYNDDVHPNTNGYQIYVDEMMAHFDTSAVRSRLYNPNPMDNTENIIELEEASMWHDSTDFRPYGNWTVQTTPPDSFSGYALASSTLNDSIIVPFLGTGFQLYYNIPGASGGSVSFKIDDTDPSNILINKRPLQYATTPLSDAANHTQSGYATARPLKVIVNAPVTPGTYTITITDTTTGTTSFSVADPSSTNIGNGDYTADYTSTNGEISIPVQYAGKNTWFNSTIFYPNDKFYFTVRNNYVNSVSMAGSDNYASKAVRVFGLENKGHILKITHDDANAVWLDALKIYHPIGGREVNAFSKYKTYTSFSQATAYTAEATALFARMTTQPTATRKGLINTLISDLKSAGVWSKLEEFYVLASHDEQSALLNWISTSHNLTKVGTPTFTIDRGITGNGTDGYLDPSYTPSIDATKITINDVSIGVYVRQTVSESINDITCDDGTNAETIRTNYSSGYVGGTLNDRNWLSFLPTANIGLGLFQNRRANASDKQLLHNGVQKTTSNISSTGLPTVSMFFIKHGSTYATKQYCMFYVGQSLTDSESLSFFNSLETYLDAIGAGVIP